MKYGLQVFDYIDQNALVAGVKVCVCVYPALTHCETTDEEGKAELDVPADSDVAVLIDGSAHDYIKLLATFRTNGDDYLGNEFILLAASLAMEFADAAGCTYDPRKGTVVGQAFDADFVGVGDVTVELSPSAGTGPSYYDSEGAPDKSLTSTSAGGPGLAVFGAVPPGDYTLTFSGRKCTAEMDACAPRTNPSCGCRYSQVFDRWPASVANDRRLSNERDDDRSYPTGGRST